MTDERWESVISLIGEKFGVDSHRTEDLPFGPGSVEIVEFQGPLGKMKLERTSKPVVLDKKTHYSNRVGSSMTVDYVYSETENTNKLKVYKWDDERGDWMEADGGSLGVV